MSTFAAAVLNVGACGGEDPFVGPDDVVSLHVVLEGGSRNAAVSDTIENVTFVVTDFASKKPAKGAQLEIVGGNVAAGFDPVTVTPINAVTDASGRATVRLVLGTRADTQRVVVRGRLGDVSSIHHLVLGVAVPGRAVELVEVRRVPITHPFSRVLGDSGSSTVTFEARDRFGNVIDMSTGTSSHRLACTSADSTVVTVLTSVDSCTVFAVDSGTTNFSASFDTTTFGTGMYVIPYRILTTSAPGDVARLTIFQSATRALGMLLRRSFLSGFTVSIYRATPGGGFTDDGSSLDTGGLWISPGGVAWAVGRGAHTGRVQRSTTAGIWEDVSLPAEMSAWAPRRVYGFGPSFVVLTATRGVQFTLWAQTAAGWTDLAFPDSGLVQPFVAVESPNSLYIADPLRNRSWHWNGNSWRQVTLDSPGGAALSLSIITAALDGTTYGRLATDSATTSYRLRDGIATRIPWPHDIADFAGRVIRMGFVDNPDPSVRVLPLHGAYRFHRPSTCPLSDSEFDDLHGISSGPDGKVWYTAALIAFSGSLTGLCRTVTYVPR